MGEVYRAYDSKLRREVAIKVLPAGAADSPESRERLAREARKLSALNHPHICPVFELGEDGDLTFLVMPVLEGESLAGRLKKGPLPFATVLDLGEQIADALSRAHDSGIVHLDLKPANILVTKDGVKILDFGLARSVAPDPTGGAIDPERLGGEVPTRSASWTAGEGFAGTPGYSSPEQVDGKAPDARSDIFSLGAVLYEMATGRAAFEGASAVSRLAAVLGQEPRPLSEPGEDMPVAFDSLVRGCLTKDPASRVRSAHDVALQLQWIEKARGLQTPNSREPVAKRLWLPIGLATVALLGIAAATFLGRAPHDQAARTLHFVIAPPEGMIDIESATISPDGRGIACVVSDSAGARWISTRRLDRPDFKQLTQTSGFPALCWSPDSKWIAYFEGDQLHRVEVASGRRISRPTTLPAGTEGSWGPGDVMLAAQDSIVALSLSAGTTTAATHLDRSRSEDRHHSPVFLPDGHHFLFIAAGRGGAPGRIVLGDLASARTRDLGIEAADVKYAPPGYVLFRNRGAQFAQRLDPRTLSPVADPVRLESIHVNPVWSRAVSVSRDGTLIYQNASPILNRLAWVDRDGRDRAEACPPDQYGSFELDPAGVRLALSIYPREWGPADLWIEDLTSHLRTRITFGKYGSFAPVWSPDGARLAFASDHPSHFFIASGFAAGAVVFDSVAKAGRAEEPESWSGDGSAIISSVLSRTNEWDVVERSLVGARATRPIADSRYFEGWSKVSPDGRWIAYGSEETGEAECYVAPYPGPGPRQRISAAGGANPHWRADGKELVYLAGDGTIVSRAVVDLARRELGPPRSLFRREFSYAFGGCAWTMSPDGERFLIRVPVVGTNVQPLHVVTEWTSLLESAEGAQATR